MRCIVHVETTGLPLKAGWNEYPVFTDLAKYDPCRIVRLSWVILDKTADGFVEAERKSFIVKPVDFTIPPFSSRFHGITNTYATNNGLQFSAIAEELWIKMRQCSVLVAHNLAFCKNILLSEMYRIACPGDVVKYVERMTEFCTMNKYKKEMRLRKTPTLEELSRTIINTELIAPKVVVCAQLYTYFLKSYVVDVPIVDPVVDVPIVDPVVDVVNNVDVAHVQHVIDDNADVVDDDKDVVHVVDDDADVVDIIVHVIDE